MWTADQLDTAFYTVRHEQETKRPLNVGVMDVGKGQWGPYLMTPVPPCGSLSGDDTVTAGLNFAKHIPVKQYAVEYGPKGLPYPSTPTDSVLHEYGDGTL